MKQKILYLTKYFSLLLPIGIGLINVANAAIAPAPTIVNTYTDLGSKLFCPISFAMFWVLIALSIIMVMWAAYLYLTAGDDTEKVHRATKTITYAAIAVVIALLAQGFPSLIASIFNQGQGWSCGGSSGGGSSGGGAVQV